MAETDATERAYLQARITRTETMIANVEDAIDALSTGSQTYMLDTGQTRQSVTKAHLGSLRAQLDSLENRRSTLRARLDGATFVVRGAF